MLIWLVLGILPCERCSSGKTGRARGSCQLPLMCRAMKPKRHAFKVYRVAVEHRHKPLALTMGYLTTGSASTQSTSSQKRYLESEAPPFPFFGIEPDIIASRGASSPQPVLDPSTFWSIHSESRTNLGGWQEEGGKLAGGFNPGTHTMKDRGAPHRPRPCCAISATKCFQREVAEWMHPTVAQYQAEVASSIHTPYDEEHHFSQ